METEEFYGNQGPPMAGGTVELFIDDELFIGSFAGDRILRERLNGAALPGCRQPAPGDTIE